MRTVNDFGLQGEPPTHPELLDALAVRFVESGWNVKHLVRLLVTSRTYRQSSVLRPELAELERDPAALEKVVRAVEELASIAEETAAASEESSASGEELSAKALKASDLRAKGQPIEVMPEEDFFQLLAL